MVAAACPALERHILGADPLLLTMVNEGLVQDPLLKM